MKRTKRLSIVLQHRRLAFSILSAEAPEGSPAVSGENVETGLEVRSIPPLCPHCGAPWTVVSVQATGAGNSGTDAISRTLQQHGLHVDISPTGELRICNKSFENVSFEEIKESL